MRHIYLDYAATTPVDVRVAEKIKAYLTYDGVFGNSSSNHLFGKKAKQAIEVARSQVADLVHADPSEIIFTSGATESNNFALKSIARTYQHKGRHIITLKTEHKAVLACCERLEQEGYRVTYLAPQTNGLLNLDRLEAAISKDTIMISIMHVNNEIGVIQDIDAISALTRSRDIFFHVDAAQSPGKIPIDLSKTPIDMMSLCAHKVYGPKGIGALYLRKSLQKRIDAQIHGGGQEQGLRSGTLPTHQIVGMGEAFQLAQLEMQQDSERIRSLRDSFLNALQPLGVSINGCLSNSVPHILNLRFNLKNIPDLLASIPQIAASTTSACHAKETGASHVLRALGLNENEARESIRFSFGRFSTEEEVNLAALQIKEQFGN